MSYGILYYYKSTLSVLTTGTELVGATVYYYKLLLSLF